MAVAAAVAHLDACLGWWRSWDLSGLLHARGGVPPDDAQHLPDLVHTGLDAGGYHLRLALPYAAQFACGVLDPDSRSRMIDVLNASYPSACRAARPRRRVPTAEKAGRVLL
jgi:hypothetical protein